MSRIACSEFVTNTDRDNALWYSAAALQLGIQIKIAQKAYSAPPRQLLTDMIAVYTTDRKSANRLLEFKMPDE